MTCLCPLQDFSLSQLLESPLKRPGDAVTSAGGGVSGGVSGGVVMPSFMYSDSSRDSLVTRLDVSATHTRPGVGNIVSLRLRRNHSVLQQTTLSVKLYALPECESSLTVTNEAVSRSKIPLALACGGNNCQAKFCRFVRLIPVCCARQN